MDVLVNNPVFSQEEIDSFHEFFRLFQTEQGLAPIHAMITNLEQIEELNTALVKKVLVYVRKKNKQTMISFENFIRYLTLQLMDLGDTKNRKRFFRLISSDDATVSLRDMKDFFYELSLNFSDKQVEEFFDCFRLSGQDSFTFEQFDRILAYSFKRAQKRPAQTSLREVYSMRRVHSNFRQP